MHQGSHLAAANAAGTNTRIELTAEPLLRHKSKVESRAFIGVYLNRRAHSTRSLATMNCTKEGRGLSLTVDEAEHLAAVVPEKADRA